LMKFLIKSKNKMYNLISVLVSLAVEVGEAGIGLEQ